MCPGMSVGKWFTINGEQTGAGLGDGASRLKRDRGSAIAGLGVLGELRHDTESTMIR
jgi:hypothetical protein